ncbi:MAG: flagellar biosynthesis anti-sigma factor FlgM [Planctomycetaceae bacterium]|nr:MAG: flagellar biosynthesis anti-sigma factor FlgM [Planctomycetaceae bacterium]
MRIEGSHNIEPRNLTDGKTSYVPSPKVSGTGNQAALVQTDGAVIEHAQQPYLNAAMSADEVNAAKVAEARQLLASGALDGPDAARKTAEAMLKFGLS